MLRQSIAFELQNCVSFFSSVIETQIDIFFPSQDEI